MAELASRDRLQPSLLDRLTDHRPQELREPPEARVLTRQQLRAAILRDLSWLFNATRPEPEPASTRTEQLQLWRACEHARRSVLNYGLPAFAGDTLSTMDTVAMEAAVKQAVMTFEPRIDAKTLKVSVSVDYTRHHNTPQLSLRGQMWAQPMPLELLLAADLELETGETTLRDMR